MLIKILISRCNSFFGGTWTWSWELLLARQVLYHFSHISSPWWHNLVIIYKVREVCHISLLQTILWSFPDHIPRKSLTIHPHETPHVVHSRSMSLAIFPSRKKKKKKKNNEVHWSEDFSPHCPSRFYLGRKLLRTIVASISYQNTYKSDPQLFSALVIWS
jgi:hypothetical protein